ncbi:hypothetical protein BH24ACT1_BH24ACT1_07700 [soil metagenome]
MRGTTSGVITVGTWEERDTTMGPVLAALDRLRQFDHRGAVRASFLTLLAVGGEGVEVDEVFDIVHRLGPFQPSRVIVVRVLPGEDHRLDARVGVHLQSRGSQCVGIDDVAVEVVGPVTAHLDSLVEPLTLPELPVVVWCRERLPPARSRLIELADYLVVDTVAAGGRSKLPAVARLHQRTPVIDFAWLRLLPLRRRLAARFRRPDLRPLLDSVDSVVVTGPEVERALLAGWLLDRLPGVAINEKEGNPALLSVVVESRGRHLRVETADETVTTECLLAEALLHMSPDPVFSAALVGACRNDVAETRTS